MASTSTETQEYSPGGTSKTSFVIPRIEGTRLYRDLDLNSREFQTDLLPLIRQSFRLDESGNKFTITAVQIVKNLELQERYSAKKEIMKEGRHERELGESLAFLGCKSEQVTNKICTEGIRVGNVQFTMLGQAKMGVCLQKHADILWMRKLPTRQTYHMIVFKIMKGRIKTVNGNCSNLEPTPNFDCHVPSVTNVSNMNDTRALYNASQIYLYEYGDLAVNERPGQIYPFAVVHYNLREHTNATAPMRIGAVAPPVVPQPVSVWEGKLFNKDTKICGVNLMSFGMMYKPTHLGRKINLQCASSFNEIKERYLKNIVQVPLKGEIHNGQSYVSYFQMQSTNRAFDMLRSYLEKVEKAAIWYCGNRVDGILLPATPQVVALGFPSISNTDKFLHCFFASPYSLLTRLAMARDRLNKTQLSILTGTASQSSKSTVINYDEGYLPTCPNNSLVQINMIEVAFHKQAKDYTAQHPPAPPVTKDPSAAQKKLPPPSNLPPSKLDPRMRRASLPTSTSTTTTTSTSVTTTTVSTTSSLRDKPRTITSPTQSSIIPRPTTTSEVPQVKSSIDMVQDTALQQNLNEMDTCMTPYSPTQFSPLESSEVLDSENDLNTNNRAHLRKLNLLNTEQSTADARKDETIKKLQNEILGTLSDVVEAAGTKQTFLNYFLQDNVNKSATVTSENQNPVRRSSTSSCDFLGKVGRWQSSREGPQAIPFLDSSVRISTSNNNKQLRSSCDQSLTYDSIQSGDAMKSYLNASINRTAEIMAKMKSKVGAVSHGNKNLPVETHPDKQRTKNEFTNSGHLDVVTNGDGVTVPGQRTKTTAGEQQNILRTRTNSLPSGSKNNYKPSEAVFHKRKSVDSIDESFNSGKRNKSDNSNQSVPTIPWEKSTSSVKDPRRSQGKMLPQPFKNFTPLPDLEQLFEDNESTEKVKKTVDNAMKKFKSSEKKILRRNSDILEREMPIPELRREEFVRDESNRSSGFMSDMGFETHTQEMRSRWKQVNSFKLSSSTKIYSRENGKAEVNSEKLDDFKGKVMSLTEDLMSRMTKTTMTNGDGLQQNGREEIVTNGDQLEEEEDMDCTQEIMTDEMEKFYSELSEVIPVDKHIRKLLEKKLYAKPEQAGVLNKLKCMAKVLNDSLADKYVKCVLKCELKKFLMLVENIFTSVFIVSESGNRKNNGLINGEKLDESSRKLLARRYSDFNKSLRKLMNAYGLNVSSDENSNDVPTSRLSVLEMLNAPNLQIDAIINEKHEEMTKILDDILEGRNSHKSSSTLAKKKYAISSRLTANGKKIVLQCKNRDNEINNENEATDGISPRGQIEIRISKPPPPPANNNILNLASFIANQARVETPEVNGSVKADLNVSNQGENVVPSQDENILPPLPPESDLPPPPPESYTPPPPVDDGNLSKEGKTMKMSAKKHQVLLRRKSRQAFNISRRMKRFIRKGIDEPEDESRSYALFKKNLVNYHLLRERQKLKINSLLFNRSVCQYARNGRIGKRVKNQRQLQNALLYVGNALSQVCTTSPRFMKKMLETHGSKLGVLLRGLAEDVDHLATPRKSKKKRSGKRKRPEDESMVNLSTTMPYEEDSFEDSSQVIPNYLNPDGTCGGLYFVYGPEAESCDAIKTFLQSLGHRPYGSNNRETVLAAEKGEPLYIFIHMPILEKPHCIPDLLTLKQMANSHFYAFENEVDVQTQNCQMLFPIGGIIMPDSKIISSTTPDNLSRILSNLNKKSDWILLIHRHIIQQLEESNSEESDSAPNHKPELLKLINAYQHLGVEIMDTHQCDEGTSVRAVECLRNIQLNELYMHRHVVFVSDLTCLDALYTELQLSGISITSLSDLNKRYLESTSS